jgi:hypothetical protein
LQFTAYVIESTEGFDVPRASATVHGDPKPETTVACCIGLLHRAEIELDTAYRGIADLFSNHFDVSDACQRFAVECTQHGRELEPFRYWYGDRAPVIPETAQTAQRVHNPPARPGSLGLTWELFDAYVTASECEMAWILVRQAGQTLGDGELVAVAHRCVAEIAIQVEWLRTRLENGDMAAKRAAPVAQLGSIGR